MKFDGLGTIVEWLGASLGFFQLQAKNPELALSHSLPLQTYITNNLNFMSINT